MFSRFKNFSASREKPISHFIDPRSLVIRFPGADRVFHDGG
jgi:hypothetical protein